VATVFPQGIGLAATWNPDLMYEVAPAISNEGRAKHHEALRPDDGSRVAEVRAGGASTDLPVAALIELPAPATNLRDETVFFGQVEVG
jgi:hypothetical protein